MPVDFAPQKHGKLFIAGVPKIPLIAFEIVVPAGAVQSSTYEVRQKEALDWPLAAASVALTMSGNTVTSARSRGVPVAVST